MSLSSQKSVGTDCPAAVGWLSLAFVFGPATLVISEPPGQVSWLALFASSFLFVALAALAWHRYSRLTIPSLIEARDWGR